MDISESTRAALGDNLEIALTATRERHPGLGAALHELHAGLSRLMPTRPAEASEQAPVVTALGAPGVPQEAIDLLAWQQRMHAKCPREMVRVEIALCDTCEVSLHSDADGTAACWEAETLAEAARAALEKVSR